MLASHGFSPTSQADGQIGEGIRNMTPLVIGPPAELTYAGAQDRVIPNASIRSEICRPEIKTIHEEMAP
jgi:hypothetical protein